MPQADSNRMQLSYARQTSFGGVPSTGDYLVLPVNAQRLAHNKITVLSDRLRADRAVPQIVEVGANAGGSLPFEFDAHNFQDMLESLVAGVWSGGSVLNGGTGGTLLNGVTDLFFDFQAHYQDIDEYNRYHSMNVGQMTFNITARQIVTGEITFVGKQGAVASTSLASAVIDEVDLTSAPILNATANVGSLEVDDVPITRAIRSISMTINANAAEREAIANKYAIGIRRGRLEISGEIEAYFMDNVLTENFINHVAIKLEVPFSDSAGNTFKITVPSLQFTAGDPEAPGVNTDAVQRLSWQAQYSAALPGMIQFDMT